MTLLEFLDKHWASVETASAALFFVAIVAATAAYFGSLDD